MTAATTPIPSNRIGDGAIPRRAAGFLAASQIVLSGWLGARNAAGWVEVVTEKAGLQSWGESTVNVDSTGAADGALPVEGYAQHVEVLQSALGGDVFVDADAPAVAYGVDNQTIAKLAVNPGTSAVRSPIGVFMGINTDSGKAIVWVGPAAAAMITALLVAGGDVPATRTLTTTAPLTGGGDLSANRTIAISPATDNAAGSLSAADKTKLDTLASGLSVAFSAASLVVAANVTANSVVTASVATLGGTYPAGGITCDPTEHTPGTPGSFVLRPRKADGTAEPAFTGKASWRVQS